MTTKNETENENEEPSTAEAVGQHGLLMAVVMTVERPKKKIGRAIYLILKLTTLFNLTNRKY